MEENKNINLNKKYKFWEFKNTILLLLSILWIIVFFDASFVKNFIHNIGTMGYLGVFLAGVFFVSIFSVVPASIILFFFSRELNPLVVALVAGMGAVFGDYLIFRFLKNHVFIELKPLFKKFGSSVVTKLISTPYFSWIIPILGAIIIASPFPDEIGISLMGLSKIKNWQFLLLTFILNFMGILFIVTLARSL